MVNEFNKQFKELKISSMMFKRIENIIKTARSEFPCQSCPSISDCATFKWFLKWFGKES